MPGQGAAIAARPRHWGLIAKIRTDDLEAASVQMRSWSAVEYTRLDRKPANMTGMILGLGSTLVGMWGGTSTKIVHSAVPDGGIAIMIPTSGLARHGTTTVAPGACLVGNGGADVSFFTDQQYRAVLVAISQAAWSAFTDACGVGFSMRRAESRPVASPDAPVRKLAGLVSAATDAAESSPGSFSASAQRAALEQEILATISRFLGIWHDPDQRPAQTAVARHRAAVRAREYIDAHLDQPLALADVCRAAYSSARALEYAFRELFGVTPMAYARCARLSRVRRDLLNEDLAPGSVTDTATRWGFWHLGQFSKDYQSLFGELPSATLARAGA